MIRAVKVSTRLATGAKRRRLDALMREIRACTNRYIEHIWSNGGRLDANTLNSVHGGSLSYRHRSNCLKTALEIVSATRKAAKALGRTAGRPYASRAIALSSLVAKIEKGKGSFDYVLKVSGLTKGSPIVIPFRSHRRLNHWFGKSGAELLQGCVLGIGWAAVSVEIPNAPPKAGRTLGVDVGKNKLIVDSDGVKYGTAMNAVCAKVRRKKPGSAAKRRACAERHCYINREVKRLPWDAIGVIGVERLKHLKTGKRPGRGKSFRKAMVPWTYRQAIQRIEMLAEENRVLFVTVDPRGTSRTCPCCGMERKENRVGEQFRCVDPRCHYSADADHVGALNVLGRTTGNSGQSMVTRSPVL